MRIWPTKRAWKRLAIGLALLVAVALIANSFLAWRAEWQLRSRLAAIRAAGDPASIAELAPVPIPDEENAAAILERSRPRLWEFNKEHSQFLNSEFGKKYEELQDRGEPATAEQIDAIRVILNKYPDVEQALAAAANCDQYASQMDFTLDYRAFLEAMINRQQNVRAPARFLAWRMEVSIADGQHEQAVEHGIQALRLARLYENEPTIVSFLIAIALRATVTSQLYDALAAGPVSPELHAAVDRELTLHDDPKRFARVLKTERAFGGDWIHSHFDLAGVPSSLAHMIGWPSKGYQVGVLDAMAEYIQLAELPWHEVRSRLGLANEDTQLPSTGHGVLADLLIPALEAAYQANARSLAVARALRIHNSLRQFAEKNGREASGLEELDLPKEATIDPYSGEPLKLKHTKDGWVIYSVMENGKDDGGDFKNLKDYGVAPPKLRLTE